LASAEWLQYRSIDFVARVLPRSLVDALARILADREFHADTAKRAAVVSNLRRIHAYAGTARTASELDAEAREVFRGFARHLVDFFRCPRLDPITLPGLVSIEGREHLAAAQAEGKGVIAFSAHFGSWEMSLAACVALGYTVNLVALTMRDPSTDRLFQSRRRGRGVRLIRFRGAVRPMLAVLARNEVIALAGDIDFSAASHLMSFFGAPARLPMGIARIAARTGAPILPGFIYQRPRGRCLFQMYPPVRPALGEAPELIQRRLVAVLEREIARDPTEWFVFHDVWDIEASLAVARAEGAGSITPSASPPPRQPRTTL